MNEECPLCGQKDSALYFEDKFGVFFHCDECDLIFKEKAGLLPLADEKNRYESHNNDTNDQGYYDFLTRLTSPMLDYIKKGEIGLDFGCGPTISIESVFLTQKIRCDSFDPIFFNNEEFLSNKYNFLTCSEAIEHMYDVGKEIKKMISLINHNGLFGIMTNPHRGEKDHFEKWWYKKDPTHVRFFSLKTFEWLALKDGLTLLFQKDSVFIFRNNNK